jgi:Phage-related baseplate assembly protein
MTIDLSAMLDKYRLPAPVFERELSFETLRSMCRNILRDFWADDEELQAIAPDFDAWMIETPVESVMGRLAAFRDMLFVSSMNDLARAVWIVFFTFGTDLDQVAAAEGLERFPDEQDYRLQERIVLTRRGKWGPGSDPWYVMHARNADGRVREVALTGNGRRRLEVAILSDEDDGTPSEELIGIVTERLTRNNVCRGNDLITVTPAVLVSADIVGRVTLYPDAPDSILDGLGEEIARKWNNQAERLGLDLTAGWQIAALKVPGVYDVDQNLQTYEVERNRAIGIRSVTIDIAGRAR